MTEWFVPIAIKSLIVAGGALLLLRLLRNRSAVDRSWIAHLALAGLVMIPVISHAFPSLDVRGPEVLVGKPIVENATPALSQGAGAAPLDSTPGAAATDFASATPIDWTWWLYAAPMGLMVAFLLVALLRLYVLKARATVLVDAPWLTALAHAQRRMGFKHGTALLMSRDLPSPISWGVVRPIILLNEEAAGSHAEAEAIITHELAHVAHLDWAKLLLARVAVALFWFNPLVWLLAREAHQLREEAADDAVLATDIDETDYARLLVGVARHECRGLLIGAHGVAPARNSLARRVTRVLDRAVRRAPGGWRWGSAAAFFAAGMAVPVAAINLVPAKIVVATPEEAALLDSGSAIDALVESQTGADGKTSTSVPGATVVASARGTETTVADGARIDRRDDGRVLIASSAGNTIEILPPDRSGKRRTIMTAADGSVRRIADARAVPGLSFALGGSPPPLPRNPRPIDDAIGMKAVGVTPDYAAAMRAALNGQTIDAGELVGMKAVGVTPGFVRELARLGYRGIDADALTGAYAVGVREDYIRGLAAVGYGRLTVDQLTDLRAVGVMPGDIEAYRRAGFSNLSVDDLTSLKATGVSPAELKASRDSEP